jgi:hypothetical protein
MVPRQHTDLNESPWSPPPRSGSPLGFIKLIISLVCQRINEQNMLIESFWVAVTFHVLLFPVLWVAGWTLPWPKSPEITTVIEINLENWPVDARPERIEELYNYQRSRAHKSR